MRIRRHLILLLLSTAACRAQVEWSFTGYAVDLPSYLRMNRTFANLMQIDQGQYINVTRVRLRPSVALWEGGQLSAEYEIAAIAHTSSLLFSIQAPTNPRQIVTLGWQPLNEPHITMMHFVDRLYLRQELGIGEATIGRQRIAWGTGRIWNPTDLFNPINPTNFSKLEKDGVDAVSAKLFIGNFTDLNVVVNPQKNRSANAGLRFRTNFEEYDFSIMGGRFDGRVVVGGDWAGNFFGAGFRGEGIVSANRERFASNFAKYIVGLDYQFTPELYALVEYHFNGEGSADRASYDLGRLLKGEILNLATSYLALSASYLVHPLITMSVTTISNLNDGSRFLSALVSWSAAEDLVAGLGGQVFTGDEGDEFWFYPATLFLKAEIFF